ncbi:MAG: hypothetical protein WAO12_01185 [Venatoribacter sp.]
MNSHVGLSPSESLVLAALLANLGEQGFISGHHLRLALLEQGLSKREIGTTLGSLVSRKVLERVKITDSDGLFYMAYRCVAASC